MTTSCATFGNVQAKASAHVWVPQGVGSVAPVNYLLDDQGQASAYDDQGNVIPFPAD